LFSPERFEEHIDDMWHNTRTVQTPWEQLNDRLSGGFKPGELNCFAARPGIGKTMFLLLCAIKAWQDQRKVLIVSTEMSAKSLQIRSMFFAKMHEQLGALRKGQIMPDVKDWLVKQLRELENASNLMVVSGKFDLLIDTVEAKLISSKPDILFIDGVYLLKLDKSGKYTEKHLRIAALFDKLKELCSFYDIPIVVNTQLNRGNNKGKDQKLDLDRMSFSDNVGMVSDNAIMLVQDDNQKVSRQMTLSMQKIREGDSMDDVIINWDFMKNNFTEVKRIENTSFSQYTPPEEKKEPMKKYSNTYRGYSYKDE
jgi:replicative DNA helicase